MDTLPLNLRRLAYFHHKSAKEFAETLGTTERAVSAWLTGKRKPSYKTAMEITRVYGVDPVSVEGDPIKFAQRLADPVRIDNAEHAIRDVQTTRKRELIKPVPTPPKSVSTSG